MKARISRIFQKLLSNEVSRKQLENFITSRRKAGIINLNTQKFKITRGILVKCDICKKPLSSTYIDGKTKQGPWANMCLSCHKAFGVGLGLGKGQVFDAKTGERCDKEEMI